MSEEQQLKEPEVKEPEEKKLSPQEELQKLVNGIEKANQARKESLDLVKKVLFKQELDDGKIRATDVHLACRMLYDAVKRLNNEFSTTWMNMLDLAVRLNQLSMSNMEIGSHVGVITEVLKEDGLLSDEKMKKAWDTTVSKRVEEMVTKKYQPATSASSTEELQSPDLCPTQDE